MITAIVLTKNEETHIVDCIESILWCDEILVIDDNSEDKTIQIIENLKNKKIKVLVHPLNNDFSKQRNFALHLSQNEWVLFIDADERVSLALEYEILSSINSPLGDFSGYYIKRGDVMWGKELKYGETGNIKFLRLVRKEKGEWVGKVHETFRIKEKTGELRNLLMHYPHQDIAHFLKEINFYTDLRSKELLDKNSKAYWWSIVALPLGKFFLNYILRRGFLDGLQGFVFAVLMTFHSFLVRGKLWFLNQKK